MTSFDLGLRPRICGKFIYVGENKLYIKGVTYGTFRPDENGDQYPEKSLVEQDFIQMAASGINAVRTYTVPPRWLLDLAQKHQLWVMVGLPWESHTTFLDNKKHAHDIIKRISREIDSCLGHPAVLAYSIGNEIPAPIVRWHGRRPVERFLKRLYRRIKKRDPGVLVTYVNYPSTEYLHLPFVDFLCFNVFLETREAFRAYLARLHNLAGERPLIMTEIGLDSRRNGEEVQANSIDWQVRSVFASGCAGAFVFSWTDSWYRGGYDIEDWDFGLTQRDRSPKLALSKVSRAFAEVPFPDNLDWPRISVVVCSFNGARTITDCFEGLLRLDYPNYEVIVVDDGSRDDTADIAREYDFHLISTQNNGLSSARNTGMEAATGEIVAYIDDDAYPDQQWLKYLAAAFLGGDWVGVGGPNIAPQGDGWIADCVANAPGGPIPVLLSDSEAEHIAGCNMAFRKSHLKAIGGFDAQFRTAGDDVDVCWRVQKQGWKLGYAPAAVVWHHRRNSIRVYFRQQVGYGKAEALLERKWPDKYNASGHVTWLGRLYGKGLTRLLGWSRDRIYHGTWGTALFQSLYQPSTNMIWALPLMPEWHFLILILTLLSALAVLWAPMLFVLPLLGIAILLPISQAIKSAIHASFGGNQAHWYQLVKFYILTTLFHFIQPIARLRGRVLFGLTPWRRNGGHGFSFRWLRSYNIWSENWQSADERLKSLEEILRLKGAVVLRGGNYDRWDLEIRGGIFTAVRVRMAIEEHGAGKQLVKVQSWPWYSSLGIALVILFAGLFAGAAINHAWVTAAILCALGFLVIIDIFIECSTATLMLVSAMKRIVGVRLNGQ